MHTSSLRLIPVLLLGALAGIGCAAQNQTAVETTTRETVKAAAPASAQPPEAPADVARDGDDPRPDTGPIYYALDSAQLLPESQQKLAALGEWLRRHPAESVTIVGHTCDLGTSEYNMALGHKRAAAARDYLVRIGVDPQRISILSYGEEQPAVAGADEASRSRNRRSEFELRVAQRSAAW